MPRSSGNATSIKANKSVANLELTEDEQKALIELADNL
jgi:hypothetical protein